MIDSLKSTADSKQIAKVMYAIFKKSQEILKKTCNFYFFKSSRIYNASQNNYMEVSLFSSFFLGNIFKQKVKGYFNHLKFVKLEDCDNTFYTFFIIGCFFDYRIPENCFSP